MKTRHLIVVCVVLLAVVGVAFAQLKLPQKTQPDDYVPLGSSTPPKAAAPTPSGQDPFVAPAQQRVAGSKPEDMTIEQLIDAVEKFREQKSEIEKKEKAHMKVLQMKADKLKQKIDSLNGGPEFPPPPITSTGPVVLPGSVPMSPGATPIPTTPGVTPNS